MPVEVFELFGSQSGKEAAKDKSSSRQLMVQVVGSDDDASILSAAATWLGIYYPTFAGLNQDDLTKKQIGPQIWEVSAGYIEPEKQDEKEEQEEGESIFSWDTSGHTEHITRSLETVERFKYRDADPPPEDFQGAIGVHGESIDGADVVVPGLEFSIRYKLPKASVSVDYIRTLRSMTGKRNDGSWKGFSKGELLFLGSSGQETSNGPTEAIYKFRMDEDTLVQLDPAATVSEATKKAHDYAWWHFIESEGTNQLIQKPVSLNLERVVEEADFGDLGIGS